MSEQIIYKNPLCYSPVTHKVYEDDLSIASKHLVVEDLAAIMDAKLWVRASGAGARTQAEKDRAASAFMDLSVVDAFFGPMKETAYKVFGKMANARKTQNKDLAASVVTSQDFQKLQTTVILGETQEVVRTGVLGRPFEVINVPNLKGDWADFASNVVFSTNVPEGKSVRPSKGTATTQEITVSKNMGAVGITEMAEAVINGAPVFSRLVTALGNARLKKENDMWAEELERATTTLAGVDFGLRSGTPPLSSNVPMDTFQQVYDALDDVGGFDTAMSKTKPFIEYRDNDQNKGVYTAAGPAVLTDSVSGAPNLDGVTWYRDNAIVLGTKVWCMNAAEAAKAFRSFTRAYQVVKVEEETTIQYLKSYFSPKIVNQDAIIEVTGVTA